jgi:hypothetical protein
MSHHKEYLIKKVSMLQVCVNVYFLEKMVRYRNFYLVFYRFSDPLS